MVLMIKAERCRKMHDHELAVRSMYKAQRALKACPEPEPVLMAQWYEQMAGIMIRAKELVQANEYLLKSRTVQLEQSKKEYEKAEKEANEKRDRLLRLQSELMKNSTKARLKAMQAMKRISMQHEEIVVCPFIKDPMNTRLNMIEIWTFMSDYRSAYHLCHDLVKDFIASEKAKLLHLTPKEVLRFISIALYLLQKLKMYQQMMDLHESFVVNKHIMSRCNPFSLHYIIQYNQQQPQLKNVIRY